MTQSGCPEIRTVVESPSESQQEHRGDVRVFNKETRQVLRIIGSIDPSGIGASTTLTTCAQMTEVMSDIDRTAVGHTLQEKARAVRALWCGVNLSECERIVAAYKQR